MANNGTRRQMTGARAGRSLQAFKVITQQGATKAAIIGRGNPFVRDNGTAVRIFNVALFPDMEAANKASAAYKEGLKAEIAGDAQAAHDHFIAALNGGMSFSVLEANAADYQQAYEVAVKVELVDSTKNPGQKVLVLNQPKPIAVADTTTGVSSDMFEIPTAKAAPTGKQAATI